MKLQVNTSGAWRNVVDFTVAQSSQVVFAVKLLQAALGSSAKWCIVDDKGNRKWL